VACDAGNGEQHFIFREGIMATRLHDIRQTRIIRNGLLFKAVALLLGVLSQSAPTYGAPSGVLLDRTASCSSDHDECATMADARTYRHCHNIATRVYCHKGAPLIRNWPPHAATSGADRRSAFQHDADRDDVDQRPDRERH
jgi:hypothetical protein